MKKINYFYIGLLFAIIFLILVFFTIITSPKDYFYGQKVRVKFDDLLNIKIGSQIRIKGVIVGNVSNIILSKNYESLLVELKFNNEVKFYSNYSIKINADSVFGGAYINVDVGDKKSGQLEIDKNYIFFSEKTIPIAEQIKNTFKTIQTQVENFSDFNKTIQNIAEKVNQAEGTIGKLIGKNEIYEQAEIFMKRLNKIAKKLNQKKGTIGELVNSRKLFDEINILTREAGDFLNQITEESPIRNGLSIHKNLK